MVQKQTSCLIVAPLVGAWIEILYNPAYSSNTPVAPLVGAWIEIADAAKTFPLKTPSLPLWERGLKCLYILVLHRLYLVAPLVGAWIEIGLFDVASPFTPSLPLWERGLKSSGIFIAVKLHCRSPCGSVD